MGVVAMEMSHLDDAVRKSAVTKTAKPEEHEDGAKVESDVDAKESQQGAGNRKPQLRQTPAPKEPKDPKLISFVDRAVAGQLRPDVPTEKPDADASSGIEQLDSEVAVAEQKLRDA